MTDVKALLAEAGDSRVVVVSRHDLATIDRAGGSLPAALGDFVRHDERCRGKASRDIFGEHSNDDLGHAPHWVDAGEVCEDLAAHNADVVFCLDPWAAQLIPGANATSGARWYFISDLADRKRHSHPEYWEQLEEWLERRPFAGIIRKEAWDEALRVDPYPVVPERATSIHRHMPGAWQWRRISRPPALEQSLYFLLRSSGSTAHLRVFLDSLARQDYPKEALRATILVSHKDAVLDGYLSWFRLAHPSLAVDALTTTETDDLNRSLKAHPHALIVLTGDHTILPDGFARVAAEMSKTPDRPPITGIPLDLEASAHVITGNLDAVSNYKTLLDAFGRQVKSPSSECLRLIIPDVWGKGDRDPLANIMEIARKPYGAAASGPYRLGLLQLGDPA